MAHRTPLERATYARTVWMTEAQDERLRLLMLSHREEGLTFTRLADEALAMAVPLVWGVRWPRQRRLHRESARTGDRHTKNGRTPYGLRLNVEQDRVLVSIMAKHGLDFPQVLDIALCMYLPARWKKVWPADPDRAGEQRKRHPGIAV